MECWKFFLQLNSKTLYRSSGNLKKKKVVLCSRPSQKREIKAFVCRNRAKKAKNFTKKLNASVKLLFYLNLLLSCRSR